MGLLSGYAAVCGDSTIGDDQVLVRINAELSYDVRTSERSHSWSSYRFWTKEYAAEFNIVRGTVTSWKHGKISGMKSTRQIKADIRRTDLESLHLPNEEIMVYGLYAGGETLLSPDEFYHNRRMYDRRIRILTGVLTFFLLANGLFSVSNYFNYAVAGIAVIATFLMRVFEFGLY